MFYLGVTGWGIWEVRGLRGFGLGGFVVNSGFVVGVQGARWKGLVCCKDSHLDSIGMIMWVVLLHWVRVCDYSCWYSVCYQQTVFIVSLCGCIFLFVLFITVFVLCVMGQKMLIVISGFDCIYKCIFLVIILNFSSLVVVVFLLLLFLYLFFFPWETGESMFLCVVLFHFCRFSTKFMFKILSWFNLLPFL